MRGMTVTETYMTENCIYCGVAFAVTDQFQRERRRDHRSFYCPNGHGQHYNAENEEQRLKRELDAARDALAASRTREAEEAKRHAATKGQLTKVRNRIEKGICPDCNRHFVNVERHMKTKHSNA